MRGLPGVSRVLPGKRLGANEAIFGNPARHRLHFDARLGLPFRNPPAGWEHLFSPTASTTASPSTLQGGKRCPPRSAKGLSCDAVLFSCGANATNEC